MIVLLVHLTSHALEVSLIRKNARTDRIDVFLPKSIPLHENLKNYLQEANRRLTETKEKIDKVACILGGSLYSSKTAVISRSFDKLTKIDQSFIQKLATKEAQGFEIENEILHTKINGYSTSKPVGKEGSVVEITVYQSFAKPEIINELKENILPISKKISFHTFPYIAFKILAVLGSGFKPFMMIEIEKDLSVFSLMNSQGFFENASIEIGTDSILAAIERRLAVDEKVALSLLKMKSENTLEPAVNQKLDEAIQESMQKWNEESFKTLSVLSKGLPVSENLYLVVPQLWNDLFKQFLDQSDYSDLTYEKGGFKTAISDFKNLSKGISYEVIPENPLMTLIDVLFIQKDLV